VAVLIYQSTLRHIPDDFHLDIHDRKNQKSLQTLVIVIINISMTAMT
jgi:hypothetical protein